MSDIQFYDISPKASEGDERKKLMIAYFNSAGEPIQYVDDSGEPRAPEGPKVNVGDRVAMQYHGKIYSPGQTFEQSKKFDSSYDRQKEFETAIEVGQVIQGWDKGVPQLLQGASMAVLKCGSDYAYGARGYPGLIPPEATLMFQVQLVAINGKKYDGYQRLSQAPTLKTKNEKDEAAPVTKVHFQTCEPIPEQDTKADAEPAAAPAV